MSLSLTAGMPSSHRWLKVSLLCLLFVIAWIYLGQKYMSAKPAATPVTNNLVDFKNLYTFDHDYLGLAYIDVIVNQVIQLEVNGQPLPTECISHTNYYKCHGKLSSYRKGSVVSIQNNVDNTLKDIQVRHILANQQSQNAYTLIYWICLLIGLCPLYWAIHKNVVMANYVLLSISGIFLFWHHWFFSLSLACMLVSFHKVGIAMQNRRIKTNNRHLVLLSSLLCMATFWLLWKYGYILFSNLFANNFSIIVPLGISYFFIRIVDTQLRFYRCEVRHLSLLEYLTYIVFPPTIPAGPIDTIDHFHESRLKQITYDDVAIGLSRILFGLAKKIILVNVIIFHMIFNEEFGLFYEVALDPSIASFKSISILPILLFFSAYLDFSAYSDIAIGASRLLGFKMVENFNFPFLASNIQIFWQRWHMSLSSWCMRNVYTPVLIKTQNTILPTFAAMLFIALWHDLAIAWAAWGIHHAIGITFCGKWKKRFKNKTKFFGIFKPFTTVATLLFVSGGYYFVFISDIETALRSYGYFWLNLIGWYKHVF